LLTVGLVEGAMIGQALGMVRKSGAVVLTALAPMADESAVLPMAAFTLYQKRLLGSLFGEANPRADIPMLLNLYREGRLLLDEAVTREYKLQDINDAYDDMLAGHNIRGVIVNDH
jgi:S-(hydroxymethyl)glutathione dehydrogenase/alcohol dehydrogenase